MIERILILDTETTGVIEGSTAIEVAVILYNVTYAATLRSFSSVMQAAANPAIHINRIPEGVLVDAPPGAAVWAFVDSIAASASAIVAHNAEFDRRFVPEGILVGKPWICSQDDLVWPRSSKPRESLVNIALAHDLGISHAHRAMVDCDLLARLFTKTAEMGYNLQEILAYGLRPKATYQAIVPFEQKDLAKNAGFRWNPDNKTWTKRMALEDAEKLTFKLEVIGP